MATEVVSEHDLREVHLQSALREATVDVRRKRFQVSPDPLHRVRVDEPRVPVDEPFRVIHRPVVEEPQVPSPLVGEDETLSIRGSFNGRNEGSLCPVGDDLQETLLNRPGNPSQDPLSAGTGLIPFRSSMEACGMEIPGKGSQDAIRFLPGMGVDIEEAGEVGAGYSLPQREETGSDLPLSLREVAPALYRVRPPREDSPAGGTVIPLPPPAIAAVPMCPGGTAEAAENRPCRVDHGKRGSASHILPFSPTHFWSSPGLTG